MSSTRTMGIAVTDTGTTQVMPLGFEFHEPASGDDTGEKVWIYVYNDSGSSLAANIAVARKAATATYNVLIAAVSLSPQRIVGVTQHAIADVSYGFVLKKGNGTVTADATVTADLGLIVDGSTAGNLTMAAAVTDPGIGATLAGRSGSGTFTALLDCRG